MPEIAQAATPMMRQYLETKARYPDALLFFRLGDFYELFFEDALTAADALQITLTSRSKGDDKVPMCGVPHHAARGYVAKLLEKGFKVAICDQVEEPGKSAIVKREVTRVVTPDKPVVGIMSALPIFGMPSNPMMMQMGRNARQNPWVFVSELKNDFEVKQIDMGADKIDDDIKVLIVVHPKAITDKAQFAIDQFIMRGGKLIAFLDPLPMVDSREQNQMLGNIPNSGSSLEKHSGESRLAPSDRIAACVDARRSLQSRQKETTRERRLPGWRTRLS